MYEQEANVGGLWRYSDHEGHSSVYKSTVINTSRQMMPYPDTPMKESLAAYPRHSEIVRYFESCADKWGVAARIRFGRRVTRVVRKGKAGDGWRLTHVEHDASVPTYKRPPGSDDALESKTDEYDAVMVANGHHSFPRSPPAFPGQDKFRGTILHSHAYKSINNPVDMMGKHLVIVGIGNSGVDVATDCAGVAAKTTIVTRSGCWVLPKFMGGRPLDQHLAMTRLTHFLIPTFLRSSRFIEWVFESMIEGTQGKMSQFGLQPETGIFGAHPTVSHNLLNLMGQGCVDVRPQIKSFGEDTVTFVDGRTARADVVVFATGYSISFPFLEEVFHVENNKVDLYKNVFLPDVFDPSLSFVGLIQPLGAIMPISTMQSRWIALVLKGERALPTPAAMRAHLAEEKAAMKKKYLDRPRHTIQVDADLAMDGYAEEIGCLPTLFDIPRDMWLDWLLRPIFPVQYTIKGPGKWDGALDELRRLYAQFHAAKMYETT